MTGNGPNIAQNVGRHKASPLPGEAGGKGDSLNKGAADPENWKIVFEVYKRQPIYALMLAQQLTEIRRSLEQGRKGIPDAIAGLNLAIDGLFDHTDFNKITRKLYRQRLDGNLKSESEEKLRELGVKR